MTDQSVPTPDDYTPAFWQKKSAEWMEATRRAQADLGRGVAIVKRLLDLLERGDDPSWKLRWMRHARDFLRDVAATDDASVAVKDRETE